MPATESVEYSAPALSRPGSRRTLAEHAVKDYGAAKPEESPPTLVKEQGDALADQKSAPAKSGHDAVHECHTVVAAICVERGTDLIEALDTDGVSRRQAQPLMVGRRIGRVSRRGEGSRETQSGYEGTAHSPRKVSRQLLRASNCLL